MISLAHLDDSLACVVDNNDPGKYHWMPAAEFARRFKDGAKGWGFVWLRRVHPPIALVIPSSLLFFASGLLLIAARRSAPIPEFAP